MSQQRINTISHEYLRALSETMRTLKDPRIGGFISVTKCEVTGDLRYAKIYISVYGSEQQAKDALKGLKSAAGFIRRDVASRINLRAAPEPIFALDDSIKRGTSILSTLNDIETSSKKVKVTIKADKNDVVKLLTEKDNFLILTHVRPDGDTVGSAAALCRALNACEKTAYVLDNPELTPRYAPLFEGITVPEDFEPETIVTVDIADDSLFPNNAEKYIGYVDLAIDHHRALPDFARLAYSEPTSAACGEIIYEIIKMLDVKLDHDIANAIYSAVSTDTGCFKFSNVSSRTLRTAADCLDAGADAAALNRKYFELRSQSRMKLDGEIQSGMKFFEDGKIALVLISRDIIREYDVTNDDLDGISGITRTIEGVEVGITVTERNEGCKVSVRTGSEADASQICKKFDGGGHKCAAGCTLKCSLEETGMKLVEAAKEILKK